MVSPYLLPRLMADCSPEGAERETSLESVGVYGVSSSSIAPQRVGVE